MSDKGELLQHLLTKPNGYNNTVTPVQVIDSLMVLFH